MLTEIPHNDMLTDRPRNDMLKEIPHNNHADRQTSQRPADRDRHYRSSPTHEAETVAHPTAVGAVLLFTKGIGYHCVRI